MSRRLHAPAHSLPLAIFRAAVSLSLVFVLAIPANAGDILRGGAALSNTRTRANSGASAGADVAAQTQANARDRLSRTTQALNAMKGLQAQAAPPQPATPNSKIPTARENPSPPSATASAKAASSSIPSFPKT